MVQGFPFTRKAHSFTHFTSRNSMNGAAVATGAGWPVALPWQKLSSCCNARIEHGKKTVAAGPNLDDAITAKRLK